MKKTACLSLLCVFMMVSCSKKTIPAIEKTKPAAVAPKNTPAPVQPKAEIIPESKAEQAEAPVVVTPPVIEPFSSPMIVIDETGKIITSRNKLPAEIASKVDYKKITRSFTPDQRQNLIYRFKMVPPRVLFVPEKLASKSAKGTYCIYKKKFWYWKKEDGLFYLDETYYQ